MEGIDWALGNTPPREAYQAVCETDEEGEARHNLDAAMARINTHASEV